MSDKNLKKFESDFQHKTGINIKDAIKNIPKGTPTQEELFKNEDEIQFYAKCVNYDEEQKLYIFVTRFGKKIKAYNPEKYGLMLQGKYLITLHCLPTQINNNNLEPRTCIKKIENLVFRQFTDKQKSK